MIMISLLLVICSFKEEKLSNGEDIGNFDGK
jgi:hypothetical protein